MPGESTDTGEEKENGGTDQVSVLFDEDEVKC